MFNDAKGAEFKKVVIACGYTDGRLGINGLSSLISLHYKLDPYEKGILFLFCGRRKDRCKAILWEGLSAHFCGEWLGYSISGCFVKKTCG